MWLVAIRMLVGDPVKYLGLIVGIAFSTLLMAQQVSIFAGIMGRVSSQIRDITEPDLWVMNPLVEYIDENRPMPDRDLLRVKGIEGIKWAVPFYKGMTIARSGKGKLKQIILLGVDDETLIGQPQEMLHGCWEALKEPEAIIMDYAGWEFIWPGEPFEFGRELEIGEKKFRIVGICKASPPFQTFPVVFTRYTQAARLGLAQSNKMSFILAKLTNPYCAEKVKKLIKSKAQLQALTSKEFQWRSINYYLQRTGIPVNFGITVALGILVGILVCGLTFYIFVMENLKQFGALKAIGVSNLQIVTMVVFQAILVACIGFFIGIGLTAMFFKYTGNNVTALRGFRLYWQVVAGTGVATFIIVIVSSFSSVKKVITIDPATVFRGG